MSPYFRAKNQFLTTCFAAIDRPEDRPFTLLWLFTSILATWAIMLIWLLLTPENAAPFIFIALFIAGVGDALAEPVGITFGRNSYKTRAMWTDKTYIRTLEGSAVVFLSGVVATGFAAKLHPDFAAYGMVWWALAFLPAATTIAEAKSPHTWDQPFIIGICAAISTAMVWFVG